MNHLVAALGCVTLFLFVLAHQLEGVFGLKVLELDALSLPKAIEKHKKLLLVEFYSPDCGHCRSLEPVLEEAADLLRGSASIIKIDSRNAYELSQRYGVRQTPTLVLFQNGQEVTAARSDLQGFRTKDSLVPYVLRFKGPVVKDIKAAKDVDKLVKANEFAVCGLFPSSERERKARLESEAEQSWSSGLTRANFFRLARELRGHVPFGIIESDATSSKAADLIKSLGAEFAAGVDDDEEQELEAPSLFIVKRSKYAIQFDGDASNFSEVENFVKYHGFPLVGNFSTLTYNRYHGRETDRAYLFYDASKGGTPDLDSAKSALEKVAKDHDDMTFMTVSSIATENEPSTLMEQSGLSELTLPALAIVSKERKLAVAHSQMTQLTQSSMEATMEAFLKLKGTEAENKICLDSGYYRDEDGGGGDGSGGLVLREDVLSRYEMHAQEQKTFWGLDESTIREVNEISYKRVLKKSWKDVLIVYTARWCTHAVALERLLEQLVQSGELKHLNEELSIVKVDVVLTPVINKKSIRQLPAMKYVSARYKNFPYWFGGDTASKRDVVEFIEAYNSMRHVEIPGEGPSPFSKKSDVMEKVVAGLGGGDQPSVSSKDEI